MNKVKITFILLSLVIIVGSRGLWDQAQGWPWTKDMHDQPSIRPGELLLKPPEGTVPVNGGGLPMSKQEADAKLKNPVEPTGKSLARGKMLFEIYCVVCHGGNAKGGGPVAKKFMPPPDLTLVFFKQRSDGFIFSTIKDGGVIMPPYGKDMTTDERWDLVNYLRRLQGK